MHVREAIEEYSAAILTLSEATQMWYLSRLHVFATWCETMELHKNAEHPDGRILTLEAIKPADLRRYLYHLATLTSKATKERLSSSTVHGHARTIRTFLKWCATEDGIEQLVAIKTATGMTMPKIEQKVIDVFTPQQIAALFVACEKEYSNALVLRDKAILSVLLDTGIRASELVTLKLPQVCLLPDDPHIKVMGKGRKEREVGFGRETRLLLQKYIRRHRNLVDDPFGDKPIFLSRFNQALTVNGLDQLFIRLGEWAHITGVRCSPHTIRHTFAVEYLKNGGDIFKLSRLMGHASVQITSDVYLKAFHAKDARQAGISVVDSMNSQQHKKNTR